MAIAENGVLKGPRFALYDSHNDCFLGISMDCIIMITTTWDGFMLFGPGRLSTSLGRLVLKDSPKGQQAAYPKSSFS